MSENLLLIVGPTAVGKSNVAVQVAHKLNGEIVSADSMQVYKEFDIGTAKITPKEQQGIPHYMIDVVNAKQEFSVVHYRELALEAISEIHKKNKLPIMVGGTGLYVRAVIDPYKFQEQPVDNEYREELEKIASEQGSHFLHRQLEQVDPQAATRIHPNDLRRIVRALEYFRTTGEPISLSQDAKYSDNCIFDVTMIGLTMDRDKLYQRINARVDEMISSGLIEETKANLEKSYGSDTIPMGGIGYSQIIDYLHGKHSLDEAIRLIKRDTRRFAKRQLTWFRRDKRIKWIEVDKYPNFEAVVDEIIDLTENNKTGVVSE
ncbi:tRNA dimethylallyltransferase [Desulfitispora alkaliphila]|uniref:tRNA (adenosine(37)-N6)-dimethylallyltransferase MiaA n=1 Tax=Desulfitispora alkaliphila TaxID=622674 RepID=UPI003D1C49B0